MLRTLIIIIALVSTITEQELELKGVIHTDFCT